MITNKKIQEVTNIIVEEIQPEKIFLFGSYSSGIPDVESDVDIIVVVDKQFREEKQN